MDETGRLSRRVKEHGISLGFGQVGIAPARPGPHADFLDTWLARGHAAEMAYLARDPERRKDPGLVLPGARSVIVCALTYPIGPEPAGTPHAARLAHYAHGRDYHLVVGGKLAELSAFLRDEASEPFEARTYVDTGPVLEREAAALAGIGRFGKNTSLISPSLGSRFFIGVILTTLAMEYDEPLEGDPCGGCTRCLDACPTGALRSPYELDARRCLSYLTIEHRGALPEEVREAVGDRVFGCDTCQDVCPWNARASSRCESRREATAPSLLEILQLTPEEFGRRFRESPVKRAKRRGLLRNAAVVLGNAHAAEVVPDLRELLDDPDPLLREHAAWALGQIGTPEALDALRAGQPTEADPAVADAIRRALSRTL